MSEVNTMRQMSTDELRTYYNELCEAFEGMERGSYEYDCTNYDLEYIWECLVERGVR